MRSPMRFSAMKVSAERAAGGADSGSEAVGLASVSMGLPAAGVRFFAMRETTILFSKSQELLMV